MKKKKDAVLQHKRRIKRKCWLRIKLQWEELNFLELEKPDILQLRPLSTDLCVEPIWPRHLKPKNENEIEHLVKKFLDCISILLKTFCTAKLVQICCKVNDVSKEWQSALETKAKNDF